MPKRYIQFKKIVQSIIIAVLAVLVASLIRKFFLGSLDDKVVWITFYPAVMVAAIIGGFFSGMLASIFTVLIVIFQWKFFIDTPFISGNIGTISTIVFLINCSLISAISEYSRQQKIKANIQKEKAERANEAKSKFLANMSHELRTPLNAILGFTRIMQDNISIPEKEQKNLKIINRSGEHLLGLINNVLDIAKIEAGQTEKNELSFNIENTIYEVTQLMKQNAKAKGLELKTNFQKNIPYYIKSDKQKINQILINLLGNAIKFTEKGKVTLIVNKENLKNQSFLIFEVEDTGVGINKEDLNNIFKPFKQSSTISIQQGTGLGLAISKQYAEILGGSISVVSENGQGSKFTVKIPLVLAVENDIANSTNKYSKVKSIVPGQNNLGILIVEDQVENWLLLQRIHEKVGINVHIAENGLQGVEMFKELKPDLIWMDVRMPVMDGLEATKQIRHFGKGENVKIIGVSAHVFEDEIKSVMSVGMDSFKKKPYQFHEIYECLNEQLGVKFNFYENYYIEDLKPLSTKILKNIPSKILEELKIAIKNLNNEQIDFAINQIQEIDYETAQTILYYTKRLKYTDVYRLLNSHLVPIENE